ncbi:ABC-2 transporter permease [Oscillibacter sp.]|uniref:ABC-2 transporter permease n=1 Tax=Oscillibacter sp. TaxID=1945593 RepID=UPI0026265302|nr:ABC-2 transporter permease [Oscillibacter sp.]MDD3346405.1 ABC-2 transporter permease [Oscillibacter sp.]
MRALVLKDCYVIGKQLKFFLLFILIMSAIPSSFNNAFAVVYAAMLPYTAMAYDERSRWDQMTAMMPYSRRDVVLGKYAFGWLCILAAAGLSAVVQLLLSIFPYFGAFSPIVLLVSVCSGVCILSITLPLMFRFGVEKGRLAMFFLIFLVCASAGTIGSISDSGANFLTAYRDVALLGLPLLAVVLTLVSLPLSVWLYGRRQR